MTFARSRGIAYGAIGLVATNFEQAGRIRFVRAKMNISTIGLVEMLLLMRGTVPLNRLSKLSKLREIKMVVSHDFATFLIRK